MRRRVILNLMSVLSLMLAAVVAAAWVRSYLPGRLHVHAIRGQFAIVAIEMPDEDYDRKIARGPEQMWGELNARAKEQSGAAGFRRASGIYSYTARPGEPLVANRFALWSVPLWFPLAAACILPATWLARRAVTRHRRSTDRCAACGYDLRATPTRCPECGAVPDPPPPRAAA